MIISGEGAMDNIMQELDKLRQKEIIRPIDLELCRFLKERHSDISPKVLKAACLVSYLYQQGHVCLPLVDYAGEPLFEDEEGDSILRAPALDPWRSALMECPAVGKPGEYKPLILDDSDRLYMHKLWHYERTLGEELVRRSQQQDDNINESLLHDGLSRLFTDSTQEPDWQQVAAVTSIRNNLSIISGGPGTGKTSTVVRVLALILEQYQDRETIPNIALAAPTGKAAARLQDSIIGAKEELNITDEIQEEIPEKAQTLHQLLGARRYSSQFKHNADNPVPYDLVVVDEASMIDQALMSKLAEALSNDTRLILLGDKDQLASVEAGSVLGDICDIKSNQFSENYTDWLNTFSFNIPNEFIVQKPNPLTDNITLLTKSYRFSSDSGIARLGKEVNRGHGDRALLLLDSNDVDDAIFKEIANNAELESLFEKKLPTYFEDILDSESPHEAVRKINKLGILTAHRKGPRGIEHLNKLVERILQDHSLIPKYAQWYPGKPVIINTNNYTLELFNGDIGVCLPDQNGDLKVYFEDEGGIRDIMPGRLPDHNTAYALTVHKSQGSEFDEVILVLPRTVSKVVNRELLYTAITRARKKIIIGGNKTILTKGIQRQIRRASGLRDYIWP
jgi:exodeoxyribonuclease V alpha subunit